MYRISYLMIRFILLSVLHVIRYKKTSYKLHLQWRGGEFKGSVRPCTGSYYTFKTCVYCIHYIYIVAFINNILYIMYAYVLVFSIINIDVESDNISITT